MKKEERQSKTIRCSFLIDFYGELLPTRQKEALILHIEHDSSFSEIAEVLKISRQAAADAVSKAKKTLEKFEKKLGFIEKYNKTKFELERCIELSETGNNSAKLTEKLKKIIKGM